MTILSLPTFIDGAHTIPCTGILYQQAIAYCELALTNVQVHVTTLFLVFISPAYWGEGYSESLSVAALKAAQTHSKTAVNSGSTRYEIS